MCKIFLLMKRKYANSLLNESTPCNLSAISFNFSFNSVYSLNFEDFTLKMSLACQILPVSFL